jgi:hypothetical protein
VISVKSGFRIDDLLRCNFTKVGSEIRVFQDLLTHLNRTRDLTGRKESNSAMRSSGRTVGIVCTHWGGGIVCTHWDGGIVDET